MNTASVSTLLDRIKTFLELPGMSTTATKTNILQFCGTASQETLGDVAAVLRIHYRGLLNSSRSLSKREEIQKTRAHLDALFKKYGIQS